MHWRRKWQPTPVFLSGESWGWRSLVGCRLWGHTGSAHDLKEGLLSLPFFHLAPPLEVVVSRLGAYGPRRCSREAGGEGPQGPDAGAAFGAREASPGGRVNEKRTSSFLGNYHWSALCPRERAVELQTLTRFKAKFQNNLQMWDLFISGVGLLILAYLAL